MHCKLFITGMAQTPSVDPQARIVWIDLEVRCGVILTFLHQVICFNINSFEIQLTGLDPAKDVILEAACVITESNLDEVGEKMNLVINQPNNVLDEMGEWCQDMHRKVF